VTEGELIMALRGEQERLALEGSLDLLDGVVNRRLHKVASFIYPGERNEKLLRFFRDLYQHPAKRRLVELDLCKLFGEALARPMSGTEILIDIPRFDKSPEVNLRVFYGRDVPSEKPQPLSFDDPEVSRLRESLLDSFEDQAKIFRIFSIGDPSLLPIVSEQVKRHLT